MTRNNHRGNNYAAHTPGRESGIIIPMAKNDKKAKPRAGTLSWPRSVQPPSADQHHHDKATGTGNKPPARASTGGSISPQAQASAATGAAGCKQELALATSRLACDQGKRNNAIEHYYNQFTEVFNNLCTCVAHCCRGRPRER